MNTNVRNQESLTAIVVTIITIYTNYLGGTLIPYSVCFLTWRQRNQGGCSIRSLALWQSTQSDGAPFWLVVGASGLYTPGPVRSTIRTVLLHCSSLRGIRQAVPAQVTACKVVTFSLGVLYNTIVISCNNCIYKLKVTNLQL